MKDTFVLVVTAIALVAVAVGVSNTPVEPDTVAAVSVDTGQPWVSLFNGEDLDGWEVTEFGGEGEITVQQGGIFMDYGADLTGLHRKWPLPKTNYEIELEAKKVEGNDFFVGLTFPIGDDEDCSLVLGGWGGGVCGLSSIDGYDASENETTDYRHFKLNQWYKVRLRVTDTAIRVWLDDEEYLDVDREDKKFGVRFELEQSKPFGLCSFQTQSVTRNIRARLVGASDEVIAE
ncbi:MAG: DUF1080 domain-containing protein [Planctomycetaceae bacterium]